MQKQEQKPEIDTSMGERFPIVGGDVLATLVLVTSRGRVLVGTFGNDYRYVRIEWIEERKKEAKRALGGLKKPWAPVTGQPLAVEALVEKYAASQTVRVAYAALKIERDPDARWNINAPDWAFSEKTEEVVIPAISFTLAVPAVIEPDFSRLLNKGNRVRENLSAMESQMRELALKIARARLLSRVTEERIGKMVKANGQVRDGAYALRELHAYVPVNGAGRVVAIASLSDERLTEIEKWLEIVLPTAPVFRWSNMKRAQAICACADSDLFEALADCLSDKEAQDLARMLGYHITPADAPKGKWCRVIAEHR